jgi:uncharacterized protein involved in outer membrane biogenesis
MKRLVQVVLGVAALGAVAALIAWNSLDLVVKWGLEHYGPEITGVAVKVHHVEISPLDGRGAIRGLEIGNPAGFGAPRAARLGEVRVAVDPRTVASDVVRVHEFSLEQPQIFYERGDKATNLDVIQRHIEAYVKGNVPVDEAKPGSRKAGARRYLIDRIAIRGARVTMTTAGLRGQGLQFDIPDVELRDLGKRGGGVTAAEAAAAVASVLQNRIAQKVLTSAELLRQGGAQGAIDALKGLLK